MSTYLIKEGNHSASGLHIGVHFGITEQKYRVKFSKECLYQPLDWENDYFKVCGWTYGFLPVKWKEGFSAKPDFRLFGVDYVWPHHYNSIRVTGRPQTVDGLDFSGQLTGKIELCIYVYENGIRKISLNTISVNVDEDIEFFLGHDVWDKAVDFQVLNNRELVSLTYLNKPSWGGRLYPYIGGNNVAALDTVIELERL